MLRVADESGVQVAIHTDTLNEAGYVESTLAAIAGRSIHTFHTEGAGGGHAPDIITVASHPNVLPSSTNPTRPHTINTVAEHVDMLMVCHHLNPTVPEDLAFAESRIRPSTIAAEDVLHDMGAISMIGSDSQAMGRIGEVILRTWQTAHVMKRRRGALPGDGPSDNHRARRYVAKYTICPAIAHGLDADVGSVETGKLADLVLWDPRFFGVRPHAVVKGGMIAWAQMGDANASIPTPQPVLPRPMFGAAPVVAAKTSVAWVSPLAFEHGIEAAITRPLVAVGNCRSVGKDDMVENTARPDIAVDPDTFTVTIDGDVIEEAPAENPDGAAVLPVLSSSRDHHDRSDSRGFSTAKRCNEACGATVLTDGRFPSGGHAHSAGFEAAATLGDLDHPDELDRFLDGRLATTGATDACLVGAITARIANETIDWNETDTEVQARIMSPALRTVSRTLGRQWLTPGDASGPTHCSTMSALQATETPTKSPCRSSCIRCWPLPTDAIAVHLHHLVSAVTTAAVRLHGLDPFRAQRHQLDALERWHHLIKVGAAVGMTPWRNLPLPRGQ